MVQLYSPGGTNVPSHVGNKHHMANATELVLPSAHLQWATLSFKSASSHRGIWSSEPPSNTLFSGPIEAHNSNGISIGSAVFAQMTAGSLYFTMGCHFPPQNCPFPWGDLDLHLKHSSWAHPSPQPKQHLDQFSYFCRAHCDRPGLGRFQNRNRDFGENRHQNRKLSFDRGPSRFWSRTRRTEGVNLPLHHEVQQFSSGTGSPGWSRKEKEP